MPITGTTGCGRIIIKDSSPPCSEYFYIPRGRVVFHKDTGRYTILHGGLKKQELNKIRKFFCIPKELADFGTDFHYSMDDVDAYHKMIDFSEYPAIL